MPTTTTTTGLTAMHAAIEAPVHICGLGRGVGFGRALLNAEFHAGPIVLQRRSQGAVEAALAIVSHEAAEVRVRLFINGEWSDTPITVEVDSMQGDNWFAVNSEALAEVQREREYAAMLADRRVMIPRSSDEARVRADLLRLYGQTGPALALDRLADWLPGGSRNAQVHEFAAEIDLCGEYEAAVCPTLGWLPRRGAGNSRAVLCEAWRAAMDAIEAEAEDVFDAVNRALGRLDRGGVVNRAIIEHAESHLESHKRPGVNALLAELDMDGMDSTRVYEVEVRVERSRTVLEYAVVTVEVEAEDEDEARELGAEQATDDLYYADWIIEDDHYESDINDVTVEDVTVQ